MGEEQWFKETSAVLREAKICTPSILIDMQILTDNCVRIRKRHQNLPIRLSLKSLPAFDLIEHIWQSLENNGLMIFHLPFLLQARKRDPATSIMLGKPLPTAALELFTDQFPNDSKTMWLVDSIERLNAYKHTLEKREEKLQIILEIDVGLHRGGFTRDSNLNQALATIQKSPELELRGMMAYDAHLASLPQWLQPMAAKRVFKEITQIANLCRPFANGKPFSINSAGSLTEALHLETPATEITIGSAFLKPVDFDIPTLSEVHEAVYLVTPILKHLDGVQLPFISNFKKLWDLIFGNGRDSIFVYGGNWLAAPAWPRSAKISSLYGQSSNQQLYTIPRSLEGGLEDYMYLRPTQSEKMVRDYGNILALSGTGRLSTWPCLTDEPS